MCNFEETTGALQILFNAGFRGQQAGRALKSALADLANPTTTMQDKFKELGISLNSINPTMNKFDDILNVIKRSGASTSDIIAAFGKVAGPQMAVLIKKGGDALKKYTKDVTNTNAAAEAYAIQNDTLAGSFDFLSSKAEGVAITFGEELEPGLRLAIDTLRKLLIIIEPVAGAFGGLINVILQLVSLPINTILTGLTEGFKNVDPAVKEATDAIDNANKALSEAEGLQNTANKIESLTTEYEKLTSKTNLTKGEQDRLKTVIAELEDLVPDSVKTFDEYGNAIEISGNKSREAAKLMLETRQAVIQEAKTRLELMVPALEYTIEKYGEEAKAIKKERAELSSNAGASRLRIALLKEFTTEVEKRFKFSGSHVSAFNTTLKDMEDRFKKAGVSQLNFAKTSQGSRIQMQKLYGVLQVSEEAIEKLQENGEKTTEIELNVEDARKKLKQLEELTLELENVQRGLLGLKKIDPVDDKAIIKAKDLFNPFAGMPLAFEKISDAAKNANKNTDEFFDNLKDDIIEAARIAEELANALISFSRASTDAKLEDLDRQLQAELEAKGLLEETEIERLQREYDEAKKTGDQELIDEKKKALDRAKIEEEYEKKKAQIQYKAAENEWFLKLLSATASAAQSILTASASAPWPYNLVPIGFATGIGGVQVATVAASKPKPPAFQFGGIVPGNSSAGDTVPIMATAGEGVFNKAQQQKLFDIANGNTAPGGGLVKVIVPVNLDGVQVAEIVANVFNSGVVTLDQERALRE